MRRSPIARNTPLKRAGPPPPVGRRGRRLKAGDDLLRASTKASGRCEFIGMDGIICEGGLEDMHILSRRDERIRHEPLNHVCGCHAHHVFYTNNHRNAFLPRIEAIWPGRIEKLRALSLGNDI